MLTSSDSKKDSVYPKRTAIQIQRVIKNGSNDTEILFQNEHITESDISLHRSNALILQRLEYNARCNLNSNANPKAAYLLSQLKMLAQPLKNRA